MRLKELKSMIIEEYSKFMAEQDAPMVDVEPGDVDVMAGGEDAESELRKIYDMLKAYFEGGEGEAGAEDLEDMGDMDDMDDAEMGPEEEEEDKEEEALQERFKKLANIIKG